ncbi:MAG: tetratricopeptide repeat protein, partial [Gallionella sp.]
DYAEVHCVLGVALKELGNIDDAIACFQAALKIDPRLVEARTNLGAAIHDIFNNCDVLMDSGQFNEALANYQRVLEIDPDFSEAHCNLGLALEALGKFEDAVTSYRRALAIKPDFAAAHNNLGLALQSLGKLHDAVASYRRALEIKPDFAAANLNLGNALKDLGQLDAAVEYYRRALEINPGYSDAHSNLLFALNYTGHAPSYCFEQARRFGHIVADKAARFSEWQCTAGPERLRVGLVSGDLYGHPVGFFLENLLAHLDPSRIELIAYPTHHKQDELTARIRRYFSAWQPLLGLNDEAAAHLIHADGVHVLIDLSGHTAHNRLPVFAWKPAPVQVSWLGYFATTGMAEMDYLLADAVGVPEARQAQFTESVWYLPDTRLCFTAPAADLAVAPLPAIKNGHITFGCFQNLTKVNDGVLELWGKILAALPDATLRLQCKQFSEPSLAAQLLQRLQRHGIDPARVAIHGSARREDYLAAHAEVDMILDTFPYPGGTTTCEALWMGVPTLTLAGDSLLARQGASLLGAAGLSDWVANSREAYVAKAIALASDLPGLARLRAGLRAQVLTSPLFDAPRFARHFEQALWGMWQRHHEQQGKPA